MRPKVGTKVTLRMHSRTRDLAGNAYNEHMLFLLHIMFLQAYNEREMAPISTSRVHPFTKMQVKTGHAMLTVNQFFNQLSKM